MLCSRAWLCLGVLQLVAVVVKVKGGSATWLSSSAVVSLPKHPSCARLPALTDQKGVKDGRALLEGEAGAAMPDAAAAAAVPRDGTAPNGVPNCLCSPDGSLWGTVQAAPSTGVASRPCFSPCISSVADPCFIGLLLVATAERGSQNLLCDPRHA